MGHTLEGDKHTLCYHIFKANWMSTLLQQQPFFILNHGKSPSPTKGKEQSPVLHAIFKKRKRKDRSNEAYSLTLCHTGLKLQMFSCWTSAVHFPLQYTWIQTQNQPFQEGRIFSPTFHNRSMKQCIFQTFWYLRVAPHRWKTITPSSFHQISRDFTKAIRDSASLHTFYVYEEASGGDRFCPLQLE